MFFTDNDFGAPNLLNETGPAVLPSTVWKFDPDAESLQPVITRADIPDPNGVAVNLNATKLYVSDTPVSYIRGQGIGTLGSPAIYVYDLTERLVPVNKKLFSFSRTRIPDGIKVDRFGRVWCAEGEGVVVRDSLGKVLGVFNDKVLLDSHESDISNFALFRDRLVILAEERIWSIQLGQTLL
jgi:gluconolactonase